MAKNVTGEGRKLRTLNKGAAVLSGQVYAVGSHVGVAETDIPAGEYGTVALGGSADLPKTAASVAVAQGDNLYGLHGTNTVNKTSTGRVLLGYAYRGSAANSSDPVGVVLVAGALVK